MMLINEGGKCISTKARLTTTSSLSDSISLGFQTLLQIHLKILEIFITAIQGPTTKRPCNAKGKNCYIKTW
jgi:hypothetical protein